MKLYIDMDGVLADFDRAIRQHLGFNHKSHSGQTDSPSWFEGLVPDIKDFWLSIPPMAEGMAMWNTLSHLKPHILSAFASWDLRSKVDKLVWIKKHIGHLPADRIHIVRRSQKQNFAFLNKTPNILVDDYQKNITEWFDAGGIGILYKNANQAIASIRQYIPL